MSKEFTTRNLDKDVVTRTCRLRHKEGVFYLVRTGPSNTRVANLDPPRESGFLVKNSTVYDIQKTNPVALIAGEGTITNVLPLRRLLWYYQPTFREMPYGVKDVFPKIVRSGERIKCYVKDCTQFVRPPRKHQAGEACKHHGVYSHASLTFTYLKEEAYRNVLADRQLFDALNNHRFKFESRCHYERSEDAVTASVFLSFREVGCLHEVVRWLTGKVIPEAEIQLHLWGINVQTLEPLDLLIAARNRFERGLPHGRPSSEPDCMMYVPGKLLIIIEAKLASSNPYVVPDEVRKSPISLTHAEILARSNDVGVRTLDYAMAATDPVPQQLFRYWQLGSWMALMSDTGAEFHLANLTRLSYGVASQDDFRSLVKEPNRDRFHTLSWEDLYVLSNFHKEKLARMRVYLENKTLNLRQAFALGRTWAA